MPSDEESVVLRNDGLFAFADLRQRWHDPQGETVETCTILTTEANEIMRPLHERMQVILGRGSDALWLEPTADASSLRALLLPYPAEKMEAFPVNPWVSDPKHEGPRCLVTLPHLVFNQSPQVARSATVVAQ